MPIKRHRRSDRRSDRRFGSPQPQRRVGSAKRGGGGVPEVFTALRLWILAVDGCSVNEVEDRVVFLRYVGVVTLRYSWVTRRLTL